MTTTTDLPPTVSTYYELMDGPDKSRVADVFAEDATVVDDGHTYRGRAEITGWLSGPASEYTTTSTRLSVQRSGTTTVVVILLEGDFPGGRVELRYEFLENADGLLDALSITA